MSNQDYPNEFLIIIEKARSLAIQEDVLILKEIKKISEEEAFELAKKINPPYSEDEKRKMYKKLYPIIFNK